MSNDFYRISRLPPYAFNSVNELKMSLRRKGDDVVDLGMGNPTLPTPQYIVDKLCEAAQKPVNHRYSVSRGIYKLRLAVANWYKHLYDVDVDPDAEAVATMGSKEGLAHLVLAMLAPGDTVLVPNPSYPIHAYSVIIAGGNIHYIPMRDPDEFIREARIALETIRPKPAAIIANFPHNPTAMTCELRHFEELVQLAREHQVYVIHDLAYGDLVFDGYKAPSILQVPGAKDWCIELTTLSKGYSMAGWRVAFACGNRKLVHALTRMKSYLDYGMFQPIQIAATVALDDPDHHNPTVDITEAYRIRRDAMVDGLQHAGWAVEPPKGSMFLWAKIPERFESMGSLEFSHFLLREGKVAVSPGIAFGSLGEGFVRFAFIENEQRIRQATRGIKKAFAAATPESIAEYAGERK